MANPDVLQQYEAYFDLFSRPGWALLMEDLESMLEGLDSLDYVANLEELHFKKGQITILRRLLGMKNAMEAAYEDLTETESVGD